MSAISTIAKPSRISIKEEYVRSAFESIMSRKPGGDGRHAAIVLVAALGVFVAALLFAASSASGAPEAKPPPKKAEKKKPKVEAAISRGQLNVLGTAKKREDRAAAEAGQQVPTSG